MSNEMPQNPDDISDEARAMTMRSEEEWTRSDLVTFLYVLIRNGDVSPSEIEEAIATKNEGAYHNVFCNGWLARYAKDIVRRLTDEPPERIDPPFPMFPDDYRIDREFSTHHQGGSEVKTRVTLKVRDPLGHTRQFSGIAMTPGEAEKEAMEKARSSLTDDHCDS